MLQYLRLLLHRVFFALLVCSWVRVDSEISFRLGLIPTPGEEPEPLLVCRGQRLADAVADFLIDQGLHTEDLQPIQREYVRIMRRSCTLLQDSLLHELSPCNETDSPRQFIDHRNKFVTLYGSDGREMKVYLRQGYSSSELARCACSKFGDCSFSDFEAMENNIGRFTAIGAAEVDIAGLARLSHCGFRPEGILDVGANVGSWATAASSVFPAAAVLMVEANAAHAPALQRTGFAFEIALIGNSSEEQVTFYRRGGAGEGDLGTGDSMFRENTVYYDGAEAVTLRMTSIDTLLQQWRERHKGNASLAGARFQLLKMDLQGAELLALQGAQRHALPAVEVIHTEMHVAHYNFGAPSFFRLHQELERLGFALYDVSEISRTPRDKALIGLDALFVRKSSALWSKECTGFPVREEYALAQS